MTADAAAFHSRYREYPAPASLADGVAFAWRYEVGPGVEPFVHAIVPTGMAGLDITAVAGTTFVSVSGPGASALRAPVHPGLKAAGLRLKAGSVYALPGLTFAACAGRMVFEGELDPALAAWIRDTLAPLLSGDESPAASPWPFARLADDDAVRAAADAAIARHGALTVSDLADIASLSERQLRRRFLARIGISPKAFLMARRRYGACRAAIASRVSTADLAAGAGYSDQAHLSADLSAAFAKAAGGVFGDIRRIDHAFADDVRFLQDDARAAR